MDRPCLQNRSPDAVQAQKSDTEIERPDPESQPVEIGHGGEHDQRHDQARRDLSRRQPARPCAMAANGTLDVTAWKRAHPSGLRAADLPSIERVPNRLMAASPPNSMTDVASGLAARWPRPQSATPHRNG